jgi:probable F420-dependent oxidoreductase
LSETPRARPLKVGLVLPTARPWPGLRQLAELAEAVGFDSLWIFDHVYLELSGAPRPIHECWTLLASLAAVTDRVEVGTIVTCTGFRNPALLAKMAATVDEVSQGRLILGLGAGWYEREYTAFGYPFDHRASRFEEAFTIIRTLLRTGQIDFAGRFYSARDCELLPRGPRPNGPPIMTGTGGERLLHLTAQYADMWNTSWLTGPEAVAPRQTGADAACRDVGRDPASLGRTAGIFVDLPDRVGRNFGAVPPISDSPEAIADTLRAYAATGLDHVQVWLDPWTPSSVEQFGHALSLFKR